MICQVCKQDHSAKGNLRWCDRSDIEIERNYLKEELDRLKMENEKMRTCVEFYASFDNWGCHNPSSIDYCVIDKEDYGTGEFFANENCDDNRVGGRRARECLKELERE